MFSSKKGVLTCLVLKAGLKNSSPLKSSSTLEFINEFFWSQRLASIFLTGVFLSAFNLREPQRGVIDY